MSFIFILFVCLATRRVPSFVDVWLCHTHGRTFFALLSLSSPKPIGVALSHWGRVTHICVSKLTIIGPDNGLSPGRRQAIIGTNAEILLIRTLGTNASEIVSEIHTFLFKKMHLKMSTKWRQFCVGLNMLNRGMQSPGIVTKFHVQSQPCVRLWWL